jgi:hypothetical protein
MITPRRIAVTSTEDLRVVGTIGQRSVELIGGTLRQRLTADHADLFAEQVLSEGGNQSDWYASRPGEVTAIINMPEDERLIVENRLATLLEDIRQLSLKMLNDPDADIQRIGEAIENATRFPGAESIFAIKQDDGFYQPVIVDWASETETRSALNSAGLFAWTPRRRVMPSAILGKPDVITHPALVAQPAPEEPVSRTWGWLVWALALLVGALTAAILWLLLPACGLSWRANFCPDYQTIGQIIEQDDIGQLQQYGAVLENSMALLEGRLSTLEQACVQLVPSPEPETAPVLVPMPDEINNRLNREDAQSGDLNFALVWDSRADIDLHITCPSGQTVNYLTERACGGVLDIDMNARSRVSDTPVELIYFDNPQSGIYAIGVNFYNSRGFEGTQDFTLRITFGNQHETFRGSVSRSRPNWQHNFVYAH